MGNTESNTTNESTGGNVEKTLDGRPDDAHDEEPVIFDADTGEASPTEAPTSSYNDKPDGEHDNQNDDSDIDSIDDEEKPSRLYEKCLRTRCFSFVIRRFPRTCAVLTGVVIPLVCLIIVSLIFGGALAQLESPEEIDRNNFVLANKFVAEWEAYLVVNITVVLPRACFALFLAKDNGTTLEGALPFVLSPLLSPSRTYEPTNDSLVGPYPASTYTRESGDLFDPPNKLVNTTELFAYMSECGEVIQDDIAHLLRSSINNIIEATDPLNFNWIRCYEGATGGARSFRGGQLTSYQRSHAGQSEWYSKTWEDDRQRLWDEYYRELRAQDVSVREAIRTATANSTREASGGSSCDYNLPASAWFWFTVQTTIGYGNQAPETTGGRALVFVAGFISILAFAGILASAGYILSFLFDNFVKKRGMKILAEPWCASILWGFTCYVWMAIIAASTIAWKEARLDESFSIRDSYWFSYISTTTVGLGDYYLDPEGVIGADLFIFPFLFLIGFMFLSAFLGKFSELILNTLSRGRKTFVNTLLDRHVKWSDTFDKDFRGSHYETEPRAKPTGSAQGR
mmetsp:Transcript_18142/g.49512  ORF Transcript_18142/g.49512 Transcript_18142/m.49512 type:complete len:569 (+) Transcript_18142:97-1803(+)